jgi:hypothetical protein
VSSDRFHQRPEERGAVRFGARGQRRPRLFGAGSDSGRAVALVESGGPPEGQGVRGADGGRHGEGRTSTPRQVVGDGSHEAQHRDFGIPGWGPPTRLLAEQRILLPK